MNLSNNACAAIRMRRDCLRKKAGPVWNNLPGSHNVQRKPGDIPVGEKEDWLAARKYS